MSQKTSSKLDCCIDSLGYILVIGILWLTELSNLAQHLFDLPPTDFIWREKILETALILLLAGAIVGRKCYKANKDLSSKILLPICSHCKNIRDNQDNWTQVDDYISERTNLDFTHTICPHCTQTHYPEIFKKRSQL